MSDTPRRSFTLADAMFLAAAFAPGFILLRMAYRLGLLAFMSDQPRYVLTTISVCVLPPLMLAILIWSLWVPRGSPRREIVAGPGFIACAVVVLASCFPIAQCASHVHVFDRFSLYLGFVQVGAVVDMTAPPMVLAAWVALALAGRWKPRRVWTDLLGCGLGILWVSIYIVTNAYYTVCERVDSSAF